MNRRNFIIGTAAAGTAAVIALKPSDVGAAYTSYFSKLNQALRSAGNYKPSLIVDLDLLDENINTMKEMLPSKANYRIPVKSLPSSKFIDYLMKTADTNKLMVFHQPFLNHVADNFPNTDMLMGKPMPIKAAKRFYDLLPIDNEFQHEKNLQWLVDTSERLDQYLDLAKDKNVLMNISIEIDVGFHRGGLTNTDQLKSLLDTIRLNPQYLSFSGFMGYDPQIVHFPKIVKSPKTAYQESQRIYQAFIDYIQTHYPDIALDQLCLNGAGSYSFPMHDQTTVLNDITVGSCLVKPTDFDTEQLTAFKPASFIATPVLKKLQGTNIPGLEDFKDWQGKWDPNKQQTFFIYGGKWKADFESPAGLSKNNVFGTSTNQMFVNSSQKVNIEVDDHVFLRPHQSEFVFLQFGDLMVVRKGQILDNWEILADT